MTCRAAILICAVVLSGCVTSGVVDAVLSISEAHRLADAQKERKVRLTGYFFYHFEGSSLEPKPGEASADGILLRWTDRPSLDPLKPVRSFSGDFVEVAGILKKGPILGSRTDDVAYLTVSSVKKANQPSEPTRGTGP